MRTDIIKVFSIIETTEVINLESQIDEKRLNRFTRRF